ncbi:MAG: DegV family protein [Bacillota bacterium]|jgi:DegV family protein with EDD domain
MGDYVIVTESTCDLPQEVADQLGIEVIPMSFTLGDDEYKHYLDAREISFHKFYERLANGEDASTAQINPYEYSQAFEPILKAGKDVIYLAFTSGLSGSYSVSLLVAEELSAKYPERKIYCVDTLCPSGGEGFLVYHAAKKKAEGYSIDQLRDWTEENKLKVAHWFTLYDINFLRRTGRVSVLAAGMASMLSIKPVLHVNNEGFLDAVEKVRGRKKSLESLVKHMEKTIIEPDQQTVIICHGDYVDDAKYVEQLIRERIPAVKEIMISHIGPIIGCHTGPGVLSIFFWCKER